MDIITIVPAGSTTDFESYNFECQADSAPCGGQELPASYTGATSVAEIQYIQSWYVDPNHYATLFYVPADRKFKLLYVGGAGRDNVVETTARFFQREATIRLCVRCGLTRLSLSVRDGSVRNGAAVEHVTEATPPLALLGVALTTVTGDLNGNGVLPHVRVQHMHYNGLMTDADVTDLLLEPLCVLPGDINGDGNVDTTDLDLFINVLMGNESNHDYVNRSDLDRSGTANGNDVWSFVCVLAGG
jgi:hypothetical protein